MSILSIVLMILGTYVNLQVQDTNISVQNLVPQIPPNIIEAQITQPPDIGNYHALKK